MKFLMVYPNKVMVARAPLGLGYLSAYLKNSGHDFRLFDTTFVKCGNLASDDALREKNLQVSNPNFDALGLVEKDINVFESLVNEIKQYQPNMIGVSTVDPNHDFGMELMAVCKKNYPNIPIICGGPLATLTPEEIIQEPSIDILARGETELQLVKLANVYDKHGTDGWHKIYKIDNFWVKDADYHTNKIIHKNKVTLPNIEKGLPPDLSIFDQRHFLRPLGGKMYNMATVIWTRGCVFQCSYCANNAFHTSANASAKQYYRKKDPVLLVNELVDFKEKYNINFFMFVDDIFPLHDHKIMQMFLTEYKTRVGLPFSINIQPTLVDEMSLSCAVDAGLRNICCGIESGSTHIRKNILKRNYKDSHVEKVFALAHKYKIRCSSFNIIGLPTETRQDIMKTIMLNKKVNPSSATVTFFHPYRGCALRKLCEDMGLIDFSDKNHEDLYRTSSQLNMPQITKKELMGLMMAFQLYMKLPKKYHLLIRISELSSNFISNWIREHILVPRFNKIQKKESHWDFTKKEEWWK